MKLCLALGIVLSVISCDLLPKQDVGTSQSGIVTHVVDGDTFDILISGEKKRIRMDGIDAPERGMDYYKNAKTYLGNLCMTHEIRIEITDTDKYGRSIAKSYLPDGRELGQEMVKAGLAWHFKKYSDDAILAQLEQEAKEAGIGLWSLSNPEAPWENRKRK